MCGLFGFSRYTNGSFKDINALTRALADESVIRGTDAAGIAYCHSSNLRIVKEGKSASLIDFKHPDTVRAVMGHTRHSTQGSEKVARNNHPFPGHVKSTCFALAHNGVLWNDEDLRKKYRLPKTKIQTDSFIAVQLIEQKHQLNFDSLSYMAEQVEGSFTFSILDQRDNLYLVKGDSPLSILHFPKEKIYVYASTDSILYRALIDSPLFTSLKQGEYQDVPIQTGEILLIRPGGQTERSTFHFKYAQGRNWWEYEAPISTYTGCGILPEAYIEDLKYVAMYQGYDPEMIEELLNEGISPEEVEEYLYA